MFEIEQVERNRVDKLGSLRENCIKLCYAEFESELDKYTEMFPLDANESFLIQKSITRLLTFDFGSEASNLTYRTHGLRVAKFIVQWLTLRLSPFSHVIAASLIHNSLEKGMYSHTDLSDHYGSWIASTIGVLTPNRQDNEDPIKLEEYYSRIGQLDVFGKALKVFDKMDNLYVIDTQPNPKIRVKYIDEIQRHVAPIALGYLPEISSYFLALTKLMAQRCEMQ